MLAINAESQPIPVSEQLKHKSNYPSQHGSAYCTYSPTVPSRVCLLCLQQRTAQGAPGEVYDFGIGGRLLAGTHPIQRLVLALNSSLISELPAPKELVSLP